MICHIQIFKCNPGYVEELNLMFVNSTPYTNINFNPGCHTVRDI
jgi:hypothetical protein